jgi:hypothetical protein
MKAYVQDKGYKSAFVVAFKGSEKVKLSEVLIQQAK